MKAGLSTACLYPMEVEKSFRQLAENGVRTAEIFVNSNCELSDPYRREMLEVQKEYGIDVVSVHPFTCSIEPMMLFTAYERRVADVLDYYKRFFEYMNFFGARYFVLHGNKPQNPFSDEKYFERYCRLKETAEEFDVCVVQENVSRCTSGSLEFLVKMKNALGDKAAFVLDTKQAHRSGTDPLDMVRALGENIKHVHFSDFGKSGDCLKFGFGEYNNLALFSELKKYGFDGSIIIELYKGSHSGASDLAENCRTLNNFLAKNIFC
ncbi:MAG: sugar phosphate isomerase/epimerase [Oscillospiraceae bacterium]|nr:sugar phosphate isomerase/epimerase [Oscillospiraceae bacterium]